MADEIQKLRTDIALNKVLIVIGMHASIYTTNDEQEVAYWKGLIKHGICQCFLLRHLSRTEFEHLNQRLDRKTAEMSDYLFAASQIKYFLKEKSNNTNEVYYKLWLAETVGRLVPKNPELICAIGELECPILTTNYDSLIADILNRPSLTWNRYCTDTNDRVIYVSHHPPRTLVNVSRGSEMNFYLQNFSRESVKNCVQEIVIGKKQEFARD